MPQKVPVLPADVAASTVVVVLRNQVNDSYLTELAAEIMRRNRELVVAWGASSERFHHILDGVALSLYAPGPITIWEAEGTLPDFLWTVLFPYSGLDPTVESAGICILDVSSDAESKANICAIVSEWDVACESA